MIHESMASLHGLGLGRRGRRPMRRPDDVDDPEGDHTLTFTSSLSIPAPGSLALPKTPQPFASKDSTETPPNELNGSTSLGARRAARKSKTDALAAISRTGSPPPDTLASSALPAAPKLPPPVRTVPKSDALDLNSVAGPKHGPQPVREWDKPRLFGLRECPTFYPTAEEFTNPMEYISSISQEAEKFGLCKIVPPVEWKMPFVTNTKTFRFKTRVQRLNSIEASSRAKLNFLEQLYRFHDQGLNRPTIPTIAQKPVDLWILRKEVHKLGGYEHANRARLWGDVGRAMGYDGLIGVSTQLKNAYTRIVQPFDAFVAEVRGTQLPGSPKDKIPKYATRNSSSTPSRASRMGASRAPSSHGSPSKAPNSTNGQQDRVAPASASETRRSESAKSDMSESSMSLSEDDASVTMKEDTKEGVITIAPGTPEPSVVANPYTPSKSSPKAKTEYVLPPLDEVLKGENCEICRAGDNDLQMLLCDGCDRGFHTYCLTPPLPAIPKGQWFCHACLFDTDYGFDEGDDHSLSSFQKRADSFRRMWFKSHPPAKVPNGFSEAPIVNPSGPSEDDVEREFWRLVASPWDSVEVEYGADVHSTTHGSAMPTMETHPLDKYSRDPWNLNNLPILENSLLRYIKSDISGMTVPWTYVGMVFSTFCWHNEDHYTYSINYMHWGATKTWYGIPGKDAEKFEAAIKSEAPELFEAQPDLLFQLVTMMNPLRLTQAGVDVFAANQRAGEFVVTFPQAYHSGFNHGFNFNEAVNFALPEWLPYGRACARRYQEHQKAPVFSHDELLMTITQFSPTVKTAIWLLASLKEMTDRELLGRQELRDTVSDLDEFNDPHDRLEEQYQCSICKAFCYLSQVKCVCKDVVACLEHYESLCTCADPMSTKLTLRTRLLDSEIREVFVAVAQRRALPESWQTKLHQTIDRIQRPTLKSLRTILDQAETSGAPPRTVNTLQQFIYRADAWCSIANQFLTRRTQPRKRGRKSKNPELAAEPVIESEYTIEGAQALLDQLDKLGFESPEVINLTAALHEAHELRAKTITFLGSPLKQRDLDAADILLSEAKLAALSFPEIQALDEAVEFLRFTNELDQVDDNSLTLEYVEDLLDRARTNKMDPQHEYYIELEAKRNLGMQWKEKALEALRQKPLSLEALSLALYCPAGTPTAENINSTLKSTLSRGKEFEKNAKAVLSAHRDRKWTPEEALTLIKRSADFDIPVMAELEARTRRAIEFVSIYKSIQQGTYEGDGAHPMTQLFKDLIVWRNEINDELSMIYITGFKEVDQQLEQHVVWLRNHPWYKDGDSASASLNSFSEAYAVLHDVIMETRTFDEDMPEEMDSTCICTNPVRVSSTHPNAVQCDSCKAKFHEQCISGSCPFCDHHHWDGKLVKERNYSILDLELLLRSSPDLSRQYSAYGKLLSAILSTCESFSKKLDAFIKSLPMSSRTIPPNTVQRIRHVMRKLYTVQFRWATKQNHTTTYGAELAVMHRSLATRPVAGAPPSSESIYIPTHRLAMTFGCEYASPGMDGCQCVCAKDFKFNVTHGYIKCGKCRRQYHKDCVGLRGMHILKDPWVCPICSLNDGVRYLPTDVLVFSDELDDQRKVVVDWRAMNRRQSSTLIPANVAPGALRDNDRVHLKLIKWKYITIPVEGPAQDVYSQFTSKKRKSRTKDAPGNSTTSPHPSGSTDESRGPSQPLTPQADTPPLSASNSFYASRGTLSAAQNGSLSAQAASQHTFRAQHSPSIRLPPRSKPPSPMDSTPATTSSQSAAHLNAPTSTNSHTNGSSLKRKALDDETPVPRVILKLSSSEGNMSLLLNGASGVNETAAPTSFQMDVTSRS